MYANSDPHHSQRWWVKSLEAWRSAMHIDRFTLCGHSMGGFVSASYALEHGQYLDKLVLLSPIGLQGFEPPKNLPISFSQSLLVSSIWSLTPQRLLKALPRKRMLDYLASRRGDLIASFPYDDMRVMEYFYEIATAGVSGEVAFSKLGHPFKGWKVPLSDRLDQLGDLPVVVAYGDRDWMDPYFSVQKFVGQPNRWVYILPDAGHHVYIQSAEACNDAIVRGETDVLLGGELKSVSQVEKGEWKQNTFSVA
jgi:pimeloyl-ACP methyl ester carboxylesterase